MTCEDFQTRLSAYTDGELSRWSRWKVETHLRYCPECASLHRDLSEVDEVILGLADATPAPEYLTGAVMRRLPAMPPAWQPRRGMRTMVTGLAMAGVQALALVAAYRWGFMQGNGAHAGVPSGVHNAGMIQNNSTPPGSGAVPVSDAGNARHPGLWSSSRPEYAGIDPNSALGAAPAAFQPGPTNSLIHRVPSGPARSSSSSAAPRPARSPRAATRLPALQLQGAR
jgi:hypothetical protein